MKKTSFIISALSVLLLCNCTKNEIDVPVAGLQTLNAVIEADGTTKSDATDDGKFTWTEGDKITVFTTGDNSEGTLSAGHGTNSGTFQYKLAEGETEAGYAVYPAHTSHALVNGKITVTLPASYDLGTVLRNTNAIMLASKGEGEAYRFTHLAGVMRFSFENVPAGVNKFDLSLGGAKINGAFTVEDGEVSSTTVTDDTAEQTTTLVFDELAAVSDLTLFVPVPVGTYTGATLKLYDDAEVVWSLESEKTNKIERTTLLLMPNVVVSTESGDVVNYVYTNEDLKKCLTQDVENIVVNMARDLTYDVAAWENDAMGGESTKTITINGNGHTLTFNQTNSDWNNVATVGDAKLIIKNAKLTNSGHNNGPWNRHDLNFECPVELVDVDSDKAFAFKNAASLTDVTINDANTSDTYAIWIQPKGQTVTLEGCTIDMLACTDGRGIKIDNQYLDTETEEAKVTLTVKKTTFKTEEKSAILVKSTKGADITVEDIDISGVAADKEYAVWVDGATLSHYALVNVSGCKMRAEDITSAEALKDVLTVNAKDINVILGGDVSLPISSLGTITPGSGEYKLGGEDTKNITIDLNGKTLDITTTYWSVIGAKNADATITIKNGTMTSSGNSATTWNANDVIFANCNYVIEDVVFNKEVALTNTGKSVTMTSVTINGTGNYYALWISARGQKVAIENLTVNSTNGRGIKIDEQYVDAPAKVEMDITGAKFTTAYKAAILVKSSTGANITVENIDITGVATDSENAVWVDKDAAEYADLVTVTGCTKIVEP